MTASSPIGFSGIQSKWHESKVTQLTLGAAITTKLLHEQSTKYHSLQKCRNIRLVLTTKEQLRDTVIMVAMLKH